MSRYLTALYIQAFRLLQVTEHLGLSAYMDVNVLHMEDPKLYTDGFKTSSKTGLHLLSILLCFALLLVNNTAVNILA